MKRCIGISFLAIAVCLLSQPKRGCAQLYPAQFGWQTSLERGKALARQNGKPLFVVFRCQP